DEATSGMMDGILADEIQHVRFANQWLKLMARADPRILLQVAKAVRFLQNVTEALAPRPGEVNAVGVDLHGYEHMGVFTSVEDRRLAKFTEAKITELLRQEVLGSLIPHPEPTATTRPSA